MNARTSARLRTVPIELEEANAVVEAWHRHHGRVPGHRFSIAAITVAGDLVGVCIVGRPVARMVNHRTTLEVLRLATNGHPNACSILYAAAARAAKALGYDVIQSYILESEVGTSLAASGWERVRAAGGGEWSRPYRKREDTHPTEAKQLYRRVLHPGAPEWRETLPERAATPQMTFAITEVPNATWGTLGALHRAE